MTPLIAADQTFALFAVLLGVSLLGMVGEARGWFRRISGVLVALIATAVLTVAGVLPKSVGPEDVAAYDVVGGFLMPLAVPLLLLNADLRRIARESGRLLLAYCLAAATVVVGVAVAVFAIDLGSDEWAVSALFTATWTGGFMNLVATADAFALGDTPVFLNVVAADGLLNTLLLVVLFLLPAWQAVARRFAGDESGVSSAAGAGSARVDAEPRWSLEGATAALAFGTAVLAVSAVAGPWLQQQLALEFRLNLIVATVLTLALVNLRPDTFARLHGSAFPLGVLFLYLFVAYIGTGIDLVRLFRDGPVVLAFGSIVIGLHLALHMVIGRACRFSLRELCLASNACIGGPTTAAPMAVSFGMPHAVTPAILVGLFGYTIGTFLGVWAGVLLR